MVGPIIARAALLIGGSIGAGFAYMNLREEVDQKKTNIVSLDQFSQGDKTNGVDYCDRVERRFLREKSKGESLISQPNARERITELKACLELEEDGEWLDKKTTIATAQTNSLRRTLLAGEIPAYGLKEICDDSTDPYILNACKNLQKTGFFNITEEQDQARRDLVKVAKSAVESRLMKVKVPTEIGILTTCTSKKLMADATTQEACRVLRTNGFFKQDPIELGLPEGTWDTFSNVAN